MGNSISFLQEKIRNLPTITYNDLTIKFDSIVAFDISERKNNDEMNRIRENIIGAIYNSKIPPEYYLFSLRWKRLKQATDKYLQKLLPDETITDVKCVHKGGRNSNYDFIIRTNLSTVYIFENLIKFLKSIENITNENEIYGCKRNLFKSEINILESEFQFIIGYNIIIPNKIINKIIQFYELNTQLIDNKKYTVSDDSLLGYIFHNLKITIIDIKKLNYNFDFSLSFDDNNKNINSNTIVIRNRFYNNFYLKNNF